MFVALQTREKPLGWYIARRLVDLRRLERRILGSFVASLAVLALLGALSWYGTSRAVEAGREVVQSEEAIRSFGEFETQTYRMLANQRGYALGGDPALRERRDAALAAAARAADAFDRIGALPRHGEAVMQMRELLSNRRAHFDHFDQVHAHRGRAAALEMFAMVHPEAGIGAAIAAASAAEQRRLLMLKEDERAKVLAMYMLLAAIGLVLALGLARIHRQIHKEFELRESSEAEAREATERLQRVLGASRLVLWESDLRADQICFDRRFDDLTGEHRLPICLRSTEVLELIPAAEREPVRQAVARTVTGAEEEWSAEHRMRGPQGEWLWVLSQGRVTERDAATGRALRISGTSVDITERKNAEERLRALSEELERRVEERTAEARTLLEALRENEQRLNAVIASAPDAIVIADEEQRIVLFNPCAERAFGHRATEMLGAPLDRLVPERFRAAHREQVRRFAATGIAARRMGELGRVAGLRADGTEFPLDCAIARFEAHGRRFVTVIGRDASADVRAAQEIRDLNASLERRVAERTAELESANRDLESFSYSVSHDLRAPVRAINGFVHLLEEADGARLSPEGRRLLGVIAANSRRMAVLVDDLLRLSGAGRSALNLEDVDVAALARRVAAELQSRHPAARIEAGELPRAHADPALVEQLLINLVGNALKYSARRPDPRVEIGYRDAEGGGAYFVRDNGEGFDPRYAAKLFEPFQRLHGAEFEGSGIGLAIVRRIVERHGGRVWAESAPGEGATFHFTLGKSA
jgi:PAS domain S-box-containing protein